MPRTGGGRLEWIDITEFGGLWTAGKQTLMPANKMQVLSGAHPQVGGGLRAFFKVTESVPGNGLTADQVAAGFNVTLKALGPLNDMAIWEAQEGVGAPPTTTSPVFTIVAVNDSGGLADNWKIFSWDQAQGVTAWSAFTGDFDGLDYYGASPRPSPPSFTTMLVDFLPPFTGSIGTAFSVDFVALAIQEEPDGVTEGSGIYMLTRTDGTLSTTRVTSGDFTNASGASALVEHQARLVVGHHEDIRFTAPGTHDFDEADGGGSLTLDPRGWFVNTELGVNEGALVAWMISVPPGDLIVATRGGRIYNVQGDLGDPTVRELGRWTTMAPHEPVNTPSGIFFILPNQGVHRLGLDGSAEPISPDLSPAIWNPVTPKLGLGQLTADERFVFAPNQHPAAEHKNGPLVFDTRTGAWFTATHPDDFTITNPRLMKADGNPEDAGVWVCSSQSLNGSASPAVLWHYRTGGAIDSGTTSELRASTWEAKTAPLRDPSGRRLTIREVRINAYAFNASSTMVVTVNGTAVSRTLPAGQSTQVYLFREEDNALDVNVKAKSNDADVEAPMLESLRIGWRPGRMEATHNIHTP